MVVVISKFCGKADFCDSLWSKAETDEEAFEKFNGTNLYISQPLPDTFNLKEAVDNKVNIPETYYKKIEYSSIKDLIPYYPHTTSFGSYSADYRLTCLTQEPYFDRQERDLLETNLKWLLRIYNRCKRKKIEFNVEDAVEEICWHDWNEEPITELANRVKAKGKKATVDGIHLRMQEYYRKKFVEEMLKYGLDPCQYGDYARFLKEDKQND